MDYSKQQTKDYFIWLFENEAQIQERKLGKRYRDLFNHLKTLPGPDYEIEKL